jgi:type I restriction enzyme, S subunit
LGDEWGVLKVGAVSFGYFNPRENKALPSAQSYDPHFEVHAGDFLMSRANTTQLVGACAIIDQTRPRLLLSDKIFRFCFYDKSAIILQWLDHVMKSPALRYQIERAASGTSPTMKNISKGKTLNLLVPPHSISKQRQIIEELNSLQAEVSSLKCLQTETAAELDALLPAILDRAFKGEL